MASIACFKQAIIIIAKYLTIVSRLVHLTKKDDRIWPVNKIKKTENISYMTKSGSL